MLYKPVETSTPGARWFTKLQKTFIIRVRNAAHEINILQQRRVLIA